MASENTSSCIRGADSGQVSVANTSTLIAHATLDVDPTSTYPRRKKLQITNAGAKTVFIKFGAAPTATSDYDLVLVPSGGTVDMAGYTAAGIYDEDVCVEQDNIYAITNSSTSTINVYVGV